MEGGDRRKQLLQLWDSQFDKSCVCDVTTASTPLLQPLQRTEPSGLLHTAETNRCSCLPWRCRPRFQPVLFCRPRMTSATFLAFITAPVTTCSAGTGTWGAFSRPHAMFTACRKQRSLPTRIAPKSVMPSGCDPGFGRSVRNQFQWNTELTIATFLLSRESQLSFYSEPLPSTDV